MPVHLTQSPAQTSRKNRSVVFLASVSAMSMLMAASSAYARSMNGGGAVLSAPNIASDAASATAQQAAAIARQTQGSLARAARAVQDMQAVQAAARAAAAARQTSLTAPTAVPDGLGTGGLLPNMPAGWTGANAPTQNIDAGGQTQVGIRQTTQQAILNWHSFNVGARTTLAFDQQGNRDWVALNRVNDATAPSQILGSIKTDGQVYVINQSGIIFGGNSQINVGSLIASTAGITDQQFKSGIYSAQNAGSYLPTFTAAGGKVVVESGALIQTAMPTSAKFGGGYVMLLGSEVSNAGSISTPRGQTVLAAGDDFVLRPGYGPSANQFSTTSGNEVAPIIRAGSASGVVTNAGIVWSQQGDITLAGDRVLQDGVLLSSTSVNQRGTIHLLNAASDSTGSVTLAGNSVSVIMPELDSNDTALDSKRDALITAGGPNNLASGQFNNLSLLADRQDQSRVEIVSGATVEFQRGSLTAAQGGQVAVSAGKRVFAADGATIDVSGVSGAVRPMSANQIRVNVQGNELRDSPQNRDSGVLTNKNVWIDTRDLVLVPAGTGGYASDRYYTRGGLLEVGGYLANTAHTIGEWTAVGGNITLSAPEVVAQQGAQFNISGGAVSYRGGYIYSSSLIGSDGRIYNLGNAPADMKFVGFAGGFMRDHYVQGKVLSALTEVWSSVFDRSVGTRYEEGYTVGRGAGRLIVSAPTSIIEADIVADVITGARQTAARAAGIADAYKQVQNAAPLAGTLVLGQYGGLGLVGGLPTYVKIGHVAAVSGDLTVSSPLPAERAQTAWFDAGYLNQQHLGGVDVTSSRSITVDAPLDLTPGGQLVFAAPVITVNADLTLRGGSATMGDIINTVPQRGKAGVWSQVVGSGPAQVTIGENTTIDLRGVWSNPPGQAADRSAQAFVDGGNLNIATTGGITLAKGSLVDVSAGAALTSLSGTKSVGGKGGNVALLAGDQSRFIGSAVKLDAPAPLVMNGDIRAYGFNGSGTLTLNAGQTVVIGDDASLAAGLLDAGAPAKVSLRLAADVTIAAGGKMPLDYVAVRSATPVNVPLPRRMTVDMSHEIRNEAEWVLPQGVTVIIFVNGSSQTRQLSSGDHVPPHSRFSNIYELPDGIVISPAAFPNGIPVTPFAEAIYKAGDVVTAPVLLPKGLVVPVGTKFDSAIAVDPALMLGAGLFQAGFSAYDVTSVTGLMVSRGTNVAVQVPSYRLTADAANVPSGADITDAAELWLPPAFLADRVAGKLTQRAGADLTLRSLRDFTMQDGASLTVDPGRAVSIFANGQTTIGGDITAHGGNVLITNVQGLLNNQRFTPAPRTRAIWIGAGVSIDVSAQAVPETALSGIRYGTVPKGGSIMIGSTGAKNDDGVVVGEAFVVIRPGALLDASGTSALLDVQGTDGTQAVRVASDGGSIGLYSGSGIYNDGTLRAAAGGVGAAGGTLKFGLVSNYYLPSTAPGLAGIGNIAPEMQHARIVTITQNRQASGLSGSLRAGQADPNLQFGRAVISVDEIHDGGFDSIAFATRDLFAFDGSVNLALGRSIALTGGMIGATPGKPSINVALAAPYVNLTGWTDGTPTMIVGDYYPGFAGGARNPSITTAADSSFTVTANLLDVSAELRFGLHAHQGYGSVAPNVPAPRTDDNLYLTGPDLIDAAGFRQVRLISSGDIRLGNGTIATGNDLTLQAAQIYPTSSATMSLQAGRYLQRSSFGGTRFVLFDNTSRLTILGNGATPAMPASAFGNLILVAPDIEQGGVLRAPLGGIWFNNALGNTAFDGLVPNVTLLAGSITSTSGAGLVMPYGGTADGVSYLGVKVNSTELGSVIVDKDKGNSGVATGITINAIKVIAQQGALLDVSGGGSLTGAGFISGRGGSVDVLKYPLLASNPANARFSAASDKVYAILPGYASNYAPLIATNGGGDPAVGQQVTIPDGTPGLAAGVYTLLPSSYAMLPGAYRVEVGPAVTAVAAPTTLANGSMLTSGYLGLANSTIRNALPSRLIVSTGSTVRSYAQYNETSYSDFLRSQAAVFGAVRSRLPVDGGLVAFYLGAPTDGSKALNFAGTALFDGAGDGIAGGLIIASNFVQNPIDIVAAGAPSVAGRVTISADDINAFNAATLFIGGGMQYGSGNNTGGTGGRLYFSGGSSVNVRSGAVLRAGQVFLVGSAIDVSGGAVIDTRGRSGRLVDSTLGYVYGNIASEVTTSPFGPAVLAVANGWYNFLPFLGTGTINVDSGASLLSEGSVVLAANGALTMGDVNFGARYLTVSEQTINAGSDAALSAANAAGRLPAGWNLTQAVLDRLLRPSTTPGANALERLTLTVGGSFNLIGDAALDARSQSAGHDVQFILKAPAVYGLGDAGDTATITADQFVWNGIRTGNGGDAKSAGGVNYGNLPPPPITAGGPGTGLGRLAISAKDVLFGYEDRSRATDGATLQRYAIGFAQVAIGASHSIASNSDGTLSVGLSRDAQGALQGGDLVLRTPLLAAAKGAVMGFNAGGAIRVTAPEGGPAATAAVADLGGTLSFSGDRILLDTAVALPSGRLTLTAVNDIELGANARIDLSGRASTFYDVTKYSWGGDLVMDSAHGDIRQGAGAVIDVSAVNNDAGSITARALDTAHGQVALDGTLRGAATGGRDGGSITLAAAGLGDFAALNARLNGGGFFAARAFDLKQGDLTVGNEVIARNVAISVDGGSLTVVGTIDASGQKLGTIRLSAHGDLTLASTAVLDVHGTRTQRDSYGAAIDSSNTGHVELTSAAGTVRLQENAIIDLRAGDGIARGRLEINARRTDSGAGHGDDGLAIEARAPLRIVGAASIALNGFRTYELPDGSVIDQAYLDGLNSDSKAFIDAALGNAALPGQIAGLAADGAAVHLRPGVEITSSGTLSTSRDLDMSGYRYGPGVDPNVVGSGEAGKLIIRAGGDLKINGSITDGFGAPPATPDDNRFLVVTPAYVPTTDVYPTANFTLSEAWQIPNDDFYRNNVSIVTDANAQNFWGPGDTIPAGTTIDALGLGFGIPFIWEAGLRVPATLAPSPDGARPNYAVAPMLAPGVQSWSMRLVGGADTQAADSRILRALTSLAGSGNVVLNDPHAVGSEGNFGPSVVRTGTSDLEILAGGDYRQSTPYGVYTAGTAAAAIRDADGNDPYNLGRGRLFDGTVLGSNNAAYEATLGAQRMYYTGGGGDVLVSAQGNIAGTLAATSTQVGSWLWRQGSNEIGQRTAWGVNFGSYSASEEAPDRGQPAVLRLSGFSGIGALGGGSVTVNAGGDIGNAGQGIMIAVAGSGRVVDGQLVQTGGGTLSVSAGGNIGTGGNQFINLRGDTRVSAGDFGSLVGTSFGFSVVDPRPLDTLRPYAVTKVAGGSFAPGDGVVDLRVRGDLALGNIDDPGRAAQTGSAASPVGIGGMTSWFTLWTDKTEIDAFAAGGQLSPLSAGQGTDPGSTVIIPAILRATAPNGSIYLTPGNVGASLMMPSPRGQLELLARGSVIQDTTSPYEIGPLTTSLNSVATPQRPGFVVTSWVATGSFPQYENRILLTNGWDDPVAPRDNQFVLINGYNGSPFVFGPNTVTDRSAVAEKGLISRIYAVEGDVNAVVYGKLFQASRFFNGAYDNNDYYHAAKPVQIMAGTDIVGLRGFIYQDDPTDISTIAAGGAIIYAGANINNSGKYWPGLYIAGPGALELSAGGTIYQGSTGTIVSLGAIVPGDTRPGGGITMQAGFGTGTAGEGQVDWRGFALLYLDPAHQAGSGPLADQPGKVAKTYQAELLQWLQDRFGYTGAAADALAYFMSLPAPQQRVFLRQVYYAELRAGGREYNDQDGPRYHSYLRGRAAIASLFPNQAGYRGDITMFTSGTPGSVSDLVRSGYIHTEHGGAIELLAPGGKVTVGTEGLAPGADSGLITQGNGDISVYSQGSLLLGLSRMMTTGGGSILAWSAQGDINAGRGSKTTVIYTPPKRDYDNYGRATLSPQAPSSGAGIATLQQIPDVPVGDVDLIAPLGTIDAGEAGIRFSGNLNVAALQILNAANIQGQGTVTGIPTVQAPSISAALTTSNATAATQQTATPNQGAGNERPSVIIVEVLGYGGGTDENVPEDNKRRRDRQSGNYDPNAMLRIIGNGRGVIENAEVLTPGEKEALRSHAESGAM